MSEQMPVMVHQDDSILINLLKKYYVQRAGGELKIFLPKSESQDEPVLESEPKPKLYPIPVFLSNVKNETPARHIRMNCIKLMPDWVDNNPLALRVQFVDELRTAHAILAALEVLHTWLARGAKGYPIQTGSGRLSREYRNLIDKKRPELQDNTWIVPPYLSHAISQLTREIVRENGEFRSRSSVSRHPFIRASG